MTTQQDVQFGAGKESVFGTAVTVDHFFEPTDSAFDWQPTFVQGAGLRVGRIVSAADRRAMVKEESGGTVDLELFQKGLGFLFNAALGGGVSTNIITTAYQQLITPTTTDLLPSYTIQSAVPPLGGGAPAPQTYAGQVCDGFDFKAVSGAVPTVKFTFKGKSKTTATALATPSYPASNNLFTFVQGSIMIGGSPSVPTTTALSSGGTSVADIREFDLSWKNNLDANGFNLGSTGQRTRQQAMGLRAGTGTLVAEYDNNTLRDAFLAQTDLALVLTLQSTVAITGGNFPTFQIMIPDVRLNGGMPQPNKGDVITNSIAFDVLDNRVAASPIYIAIVTAETAF